MTLADPNPTGPNLADPNLADPNLADPNLADVGQEVVGRGDGVGRGRPRASGGLLDRGLWGWVGAAMAVSVLLRVRFLVTPLTADEGGYMAIGRAWFGGDMLYRDHWIDRPQALLGSFGVLDLLTGGGPAWIRAMAIAFGCAGVLGAALVAQALAGDDPRLRWRAAILGAMFAAVLTSVAQFEGFIANGELLGGSLAVLAAGIGLNARRTAHPMRWYLVTGVVGALAMSMRQTSLDGLAVLTIAAFTTPLLGATRRAALKAWGAVVAGAAVVIGAEVTHGLATDADAWWYCMWGYRSEHRDISSADWPRFWRTWAIARPILFGAIAVIVAFAAWAIANGRTGRRGGPRWGVLFGWLAVVLVMFAWGGQFYNHYWVMLGYPLGILAGVALAGAPSRELIAVGIAAVAAFPVLKTSDVIFEDRTAVMSAAHADGRLVINEQVASWFNARKQPGDSLAVLCGSAAVYALTDVDPPISPIWIAALAEADGAIDRAAAVLTGPDRPRYVALFTSLRACDSSGALQRALDTGYRQADQVAGVAMLERTS